MGESVGKVAAGAVLLDEAPLKLPRRHAVGAHRRGERLQRVRVGGGGRRGSPSTITTSPRGGTSSAYAATSASVPRRNSSKCFVSSRATTTNRSPPARAARARRVSAVRPGASKSTTVCGREAASSSWACRSRPLRARKPSTVKGSAGRAEATRAASVAEGPGTGTTRIPAATTASTTRCPGSETSGVPASLISATASPAASCCRRRGRARASLCSCSACVGVDTA